jgi:P27 family predicted phage terminase small subunit
MTRAKRPEDRTGHANIGTLAVQAAKKAAHAGDPDPVFHLPADVPPVPGYLDGYGAAIYLHLWCASGLPYSALTDRYAIESYAEQRSRRRQLLGILAREGYIVPGSNEQPVPHPAAKLLESVERALRAGEDRLGLNPDARMRLGIAEVEVKSYLDALVDEDPYA